VPERVPVGVLPAPLSGDLGAAAEDELPPPDVTEGGVGLLGALPDGVLPAPLSGDLGAAAEDELPAVTEGDAGLLGALPDGVLPAPLSGDLGAEDEDELPAVTEGGLLGAPPDGVLPAPLSGDLGAAAEDALPVVGAGIGRVACDALVGGQLLLSWGFVEGVALVCPSAIPGPNTKLNTRPRESNFMTYLHVPTPTVLRRVAHFPAPHGRKCAFPMPSTSTSVMRSPCAAASARPVGRKNSIHRPFLLPGRVKDSRQVEDGTGGSRIRWVARE
jgi:hypothetical protein